jgi:ABC-2 type transporter.
MNKFWVLLKKEIKDILTPQTIIPIIVIAILFYAIGGLMGSMIESGGLSHGDEASASNTVAVIDNDNTDGSKALIDAVSMSGFNIFTPNVNDPTEAYNQYKNEFDILIVIPDGFGNVFSGESGVSANISVYSNVNSFSMTAMFGGSTISAIIDSVNQTLSNALLEANLNAGAPDVNFIMNPIETTEFARVNGNIEQISPSIVVNLVTSQTVFVPIIIFLIVVFSSQTLAGSVTGEKSDKTLETLLTTPVNRTSILFAKMLSASIVSLAYAVIFMFSYDGMMNSMMGSAGEVVGDYSAILENLGVSFNAGTYAIVGVSIFFSIIIGLSFAIIVGVLAEDLKQLQSLLTPLMILLMLPYIVSMFTDINTLPMIPKILMYLIPFTHTFTAIGNVFTSNYLMLIIGIAYQLIFLFIAVGIARNIFGTDKLFTLKLDFSKKKMK